jgi:cation:H+ antiporter
MIDCMWLVVGLVLLTLGGEALVRGALAAAKRLGVSPLLAGLVIVGFGTSAPELVVSLKAVMADQPEIAMGNVIGSNISNILLILGVSAMIMPLVTSAQCLRRDGTTLLVATLVFMGLASFGGLSRLEGVGLLLLLSGYLIWAYRSERQDLNNPEVAAHVADVEAATAKPMAIPVIFLATLGGLALLVVGADRFLLGAVGIGHRLGVPEAVIGLTLVAVGTSLPELAVSIVAALRRHADVAVGNIIGSSIFNLWSILGVAAVVKPLPLEGRLFAIDQWVLLMATALLLLFLLFGLRLTRLKGALLLLSYAVYMGSMFSG